MSNALEIEQAIKQLPPAELAKLRQWFAQFDDELWDRQLDRDIAAGKLDALAAEALAEFGEGHCTDL
jgi:hypothetical protein